MKTFPIEGYPNYEITEEGKIWSKRYNRYVKEYNGSVSISNQLGSKSVCIRKLLRKHNIIIVPQLSNVEHKPVIGHPNYQIYSNGNLFSKYQMRFLKASANSYGHLEVTLDGVQMKLHRLVYSHFNSLIPEGFDIHHIDYDKNNNDITNLLCLSHQDHTKLHKGTAN